MKYKAVIFDLDGVICHTDRYHYQAWKQIADEIGAYCDETINNRLRGVSRAESLEIILESYPGQLSQEEKDHYLKKKNELYRSLLKNMSPADLDPEVKDTMDRIRACGILMAIGSSSKNTPFILQRLGLEHYFDAVVDGNQITRSKPDPEVFLKAGAALGVDPQFCLVVEDAESGIRAAMAANMDCAAIGDGAQSSLASYRLRHLADLLPILGA
ncbi:MAG TPA: beta-phosphoglucomutase [Syntrophomonas sp.]|nr:beta-phosphoglucomutase [Syntrophomonas sp.]